MAGMPQRRARLERERQLAKPTVLPPAEFRALSAGQKMELLLGCSLDDAYIISHWDTNTADVHQLSAKVRLIEIMTKHGFRFAVEAMRDQGRDRAIEQLAQAITDKVVSKSESPPWDRCPIGSCQRHLACMYKPCRSSSSGSGGSGPADPAHSTPADTLDQPAESGHIRDTKELSR